MDRNKNVTNLISNLVFLILYWVILQDLVLSIFYKVTGSLLLTNLIFYAKDVLFVFLFVLTFFRTRFPYPFALGVIIYLAIVVWCMIYSLVFQQIGLFNVLQNVRNGILLPCFIAIGYSIRESNLFEIRLRKYINFTLVCVVFGYIDYFADIILGTQSFWKNIVGITEFYSDIKGQADRLVNGLPGNFYGQYGQEFFSVKRLVGLWMGPLTAAYILLIPSVYYFSVFIKHIKLKKNIKIIILDVLILIYLDIAIYLTHTRAIILVLMLAYIIIYMKNINAKARLFSFIVIILSALFISTLMIDKLMQYFFDGSTIGHINSIMQVLSLNNLTLFGKGFGNFGVTGEVGTESTYLTILGNQGLVCVIIYITFLLYFSIKCLKSKENLCFIVGVMGIAYFLTGFISEQLTAYTSIASFYIFLGYYFHK